MRCDSRWWRTWNKKRSYNRSTVTPMVFKIHLNWIFFYFLLWNIEMLCLFRWYWDQERFTVKEIESNRSLISLNNTQIPNELLSAFDLNLFLLLPCCWIQKRHKKRLLNGNPVNVIQKGLLVASKWDEQKKLNKNGIRIKTKK